MRTLLIISLAAACGGSSEPTPQPTVQALSPVAPRADETDLEVARVNGRPVWGSCVAAQVAHGAKARQAALDECVSFELLAQVAEHRNLGVDPLVVEATRSALVSRLIEIGFEARYQNPADLGDRLTKWLDQNAWRLHRPELRTSAYARINVPKQAPPELEASAKQLAERIAAATAGQTGLFGVNLREIAERVAAGSSLKPEIAQVPQFARSGLDPAYADALWGIPEVGRTSGTVRTPWGWDVILFSGVLPPKELTRDELAADVFDELRRATFTTWVNELIKQLGVHVDVDQAQVTRLEEADR